MHLILTGATGLVGSGVLDIMLRTKDITKISILSRRPVPMLDNNQDPRVNVIIHKDFETYDSAVMEQLQGATGCIWALGISQTQVNAEDYVKITKDYALAAAKAFSEIKPDSTGGQKDEPFRFVYVSGEGATQKVGRFTPIFARVKGETETLLGQMTTESAGKLMVYSPRPCFVDSAHHPAIKPFLPTKPFALNFAETTLGPLISNVAKRYHSPTPFLGECFIKMASGQLDDKIEGYGSSRLGGSWIMQNWALRRMMGL